MELLVQETNRSVNSVIIVHHTILNYTLKRQGGLKPKSRFHRWKPVTRTEMKAFIAAVLNMGIIQVCVSCLLTTKKDAFISSYSCSTI